VFAFMTAMSTRPYLVFGMIMAGVGMGLLIPVYTVAVQNVAPRHQMGAATASTTFFRSIGSTVGVAVFGSVLLTNYHAEFGRVVPPGTPQKALEFFGNPLLLSQMHDQMESIFQTLPNGLQLMQTLMVSVRGSLEHGLHRIFSTSAVIMCAVLLLNLTLKNLPLRSHHEAPKMEPPAH
jgi:MFS family permease